MNYEDIGLNDQLQPINSPIERYGVSVSSSMDFDNTYGAAVITTSNLQGSAVAEEKLGTFSADKITAGTIDATSIAVTNIDAGNIVSGTISADRIGASSITSAKINVGTLSAITANMGTVTAGLISGLAISGGTITGSLFRTKSSGVRVEMVANDAKIYLYDSTDDQTLLIDDNGTNVGMASGDNRNILIDSDNHMYLQCDGTASLVSVAGTITLGAANLIDLSASSISLDGNLDLNGNDIAEVDILAFNSRSSAPSNAWAIYAYSNGGTTEIRTRVNSSNYRIDQTAV